MCLRGWVLQGTVRTCNAAAFEPSAQTARAKQAGDERNNTIHTHHGNCAEHVPATPQPSSPPYGTPLTTRCSARHAFLAAGGRE
jgi:hypothetical protein